MLDLLRLVSSEDVGHDEASVEALLRKHKVIVLAFIINVVDGIHNCFS